jgi:tetratricopeptide (TPR) repeat protein
LLNALLLLSPFGLVWGLVWGRRGTGEPFFQLLSWALLGSGALFCIHDAFLGGRDWDLLAFPALFYTLWGVSALHRADTPPHHWAQIRLAVLPLMALHTALWVGINAHSERAIDRLGKLLQNTNQSAHYRQWAQGYFHLVHRKDPKTAAGHFRQARAFLDAGATNYELFRFRYDQYLGFCMARTGEYREAVALFAQAYASYRNRWDENDLSAYEQWVTSLIQLGTEASQEDGRRAEADSLWTAAVSRAQEALNSEPVANLYKLQGIALKELGAYPAAIAAFQQGLLREKAPKSAFRLYIHLAEVFQLTGDLKNTEAALAEAVRINPSGEEFVQKLRKILLPSR